MNNNEFRIICTKGDGNRWIKGEIYKYKNNTIKDFRGYEWGNFYDFNEFEELIKSSFENVYFEEFKFNIGDKAIKRENNEEVVICGYIIDEANNLEYIISNDKSKDTLRQKMDRYPKVVVGEEYLDKTCSFIYPISLEKVNNPLEDKEETAKKKVEEVKEECEEDIRIKFDKIREQKKEAIKEKSKKVLQLTLEIKEIEHEIEKIKKEWHIS